MQNGRVKWFSNSKGLGFIAPESGGPDVFVHYSAIKVDAEYRKLDNGELVQFEAIQGDNGLRATCVVKQPVNEK